jgi:hypothetical protein
MVYLYMEIEQLKNAYHDLVKYHNNQQENINQFSNSAECENIFEQLKIIQNEINKIEIYNNNIIIEKRKANNLINGIVSMIKDNNKYVFSDACSYNLDLYFKCINQINEMTKK